MQREIWPFWCLGEYTDVRLTCFSKMTVGLQSQPWISALWHTVNCYPQALEDHKAHRIFGSYFPRVFSTSWLFNDSLASSPLLVAGRENAWLWSVLPHQKGVYWPLLGSPVGKCTQTSAAAVLKLWLLKESSWAASGKAGEGDAELLMPPGT